MRQEAAGPAGRGERTHRAAGPAHGQCAGPPRLSPGSAGAPAAAPPRPTRQDAVRRAVDGNSAYGVWNAAQSAQSSAVAATYGDNYYLSHQQRYGSY
jgi:hypothetical protein